MWEVRRRKDNDGEDIELLTPDTSRFQDGPDGDTKSIAPSRIRTESYQSTSKLIVYLFCGITALLLIFTCATLGSSISSPRKAKFHISRIMPSVNLATGECETLKYVNLSLHLIINCIGTIIIGCSNYLQQSIPLENQC